MAAFGVQPVPPGAVGLCVSWWANEPPGLWMTIFPKKSRGLSSKTREICMKSLHKDWCLLLFSMTSSFKSSLIVIFSWLGLYGEPFLWVFIRHFCNSLVSGIYIPAQLCCNLNHGTYHQWWHVISLLLRLVSIFLRREPVLYENKHLKKNAWNLELIAFLSLEIWRICL